MQETDQQTPETLRAKARELQTEAAKLESEARALEARQKTEKLEAQIAQVTGAVSVIATSVTFGPDAEQYEFDIYTNDGAKAEIDGTDAASLIQICQAGARARASFVEASTAAQAIVKRHAYRPGRDDFGFHWHCGYRGMFPYR